MELVLTAGSLHRPAAQGAFPAAVTDTGSAYQSALVITYQIITFLKSPQVLGLLGTQFPALVSQVINGAHKPTFPWSGRSSTDLDATPS